MCHCYTTDPILIIKTNVSPSLTAGAGRPSEVNGEGRHDVLLGMCGNGIDSEAETVPWAEVERRGVLEYESG
jgi:hypothetical protein